jgi:hypothetical protein
VAESFDVRELAASSAGNLSPYERKPWIESNTLERWLLDAGIARPNGHQAGWS